MSEAAARNARLLARLACVAVFIRAVYAVASFLFWRPSPAQVVHDLREMRGAVSLEDAVVDMIVFERISEIYVWLSLAATILVVLICLGLWLWQWFRPGRWVPMVGLTIIVASSVAIGISLMDPVLNTQMMLPQNWYLWGLKPVLAIMMIAAYRGGRICEELRRNPACQ